MKLKVKQPQTPDEIRDFIEKDFELRNHHKFIISFKERIEILIDPHLVCPKTNRIEDDQTKNTKLQYWVEILIPFKLDWNKEDTKYHYSPGTEYAHMHDWKLDCGGDTYELAILKAHRLMTKKYGKTSRDLIDKAEIDLIHKFNKK